MNSEHNPYLLIDPFDKTVTPVYYDGELSSLYALLGCDLVAVAYCGKFDMLVDDEGLLKADQKLFWVVGHPQPQAGKALVVGVDKEGNTVPPDITLEELEARVLFVDGVVWENE